MGTKFSTLVERRVAATTGCYAKTDEISFLELFSSSVTITAGGISTTLEVEDYIRLRYRAAKSKQCILNEFQKNPNGSFRGWRQISFACKNRPTHISFAYKNRPTHEGISKNDERQKMRPDFGPSDV